MSGDAASLPCPICSHSGVFDSPDSLRDRLIHVSTNKILCPVCQEEICGLDKLTIHLFSHVKPLLPLMMVDIEKKISLTKEKSKDEGPVQQKKTRSSAKNKTPNSLSSAPVKYVKIYPKLPVISVNPLPIMDLPKNSQADSMTSGDQLIVKTEPRVILSNTTCNMCGLQFVDQNILKMHRCLIHNINDPSNESITRYNCHLCSKHFKMRGSLMVHLRVAHYGFSSDNSNNNNENQEKTDGKNTEAHDKSMNFDRTDNKQWQCDVCKKYFTTKYFLKKHKRLHTGETPYACTQCNKTFTFQQSYHKHLLYHNDEKPHSCTYCGRAFKELSTLHNHQRIHTGEKPFACETCGKCFRQRVSYLVHRRIHTGVMPYKCTACEKSFRYKVSQRTHKCQAHPPGTVIRQTGELVEKLKKKHTDPDCADNKQNHLDINFPEISEANAELARTGAQLSLEDMETENFRILADTFNNESDSLASVALSPNLEKNGHDSDKIFETNIDELIISMNSRDVEKNIPSPSDILRNLCLSRDEDFVSDQPTNNDPMKNYSSFI